MSASTNTNAAIAQPVPDAPTGMGLVEAAALWKASQATVSGANPVERLMHLRDQGQDIKTLLTVMNWTFAVTKYGGQIVIAAIIGNDITFMTVEDFHRMFANLVVFKEITDEDGEEGTTKTEGIKTKTKATKTKTEAIKVSRYWFEWRGRRQYLGRGVVFEPGGPLDISNDMLNLWRGFGITPRLGDWSLMRAHIFNVVCSGQQDLFDYFIKWMAYGVQHPDEPMGVAVALLGGQGAGKGIVARTFGKFFGKHFTHIANGDQLTGRFNASLGTSCAVFLDEALWAGDHKGDGVLKALITEPTFQLEAKFRDPIMVPNRLRIMVASNNDWAVPAGIGDRRWFVLNVADTYAGTRHSAYWKALYADVENGGAAAMLHDLLDIDLSGFDVRAVPHTKAKAQQQVLSLNGTEAWLHHLLQEGEMHCVGKYGVLDVTSWQNTGLVVSKDDAYRCYEGFSKGQRDYRPDVKAVWSKKLRALLGPCVNDTRTGQERVRSFQFAPLAACRRQFETQVGAPNIEWELENAQGLIPATVRQTEENWPEYEPEYEPARLPEAWPEYEPEYEQ